MNSPLGKHLPSIKHILRISSSHRRCPLHAELPLDNSSYRTIRTSVGGVLIDGDKNGNDPEGVPLEERL